MTFDLITAYPYAWLGSLAVAIACSLLSPFVVFKRMAFIGEGVGHSALGGIGIAFLAGIWIPFLTAPGWTDLILAMVCVATALGVGRLSVAGHIEADAAIGVGLVVAMAVGIAGLDVYSWLRPEAYRPDVDSILFGEPLAVGQGLCLWAWIVAVLTAGLVITGYRYLVFYTFDEEGALIFGVPVEWIRRVFLLVMALTIVAAIRVVGVVLVTSLLVIPGLIGRAITRKFTATIISSLVSGVIGMTVGLVLFAGLGHFTSGPVVVLVLALMLAMAISYRAIADNLRQKSFQSPSARGPAAASSDK